MIFIAASGSGGHLLPAVYVAEAIQRLAPHEEILFLGAGRPLEKKLIDDRGFQRVVIPISGVAGLGVRGFIKFLFTAPKTFVAMIQLFRKFQPRVVVGVGGYVSVAPVLYASLIGTPTWIHEAEKHPGLANRLLARVASVVSTAFPNTHVAGAKTIIFTGHPVRSDLHRVKNDTREISEPRRILVLGGSQGAQALDMVVPKILNGQKNVSVVHQCRKENEDAVRAAYHQSGIEAQVTSFFDDLSTQYLWSDLIISRAGAGSVMELSVCNRPVIFVPFPYAQGNHQKENAKFLSDAGKATIVEEGEGFSERLATTLLSFLNPENYARMRALPYEARSLDAAEKIAAGILGLFEMKKSPTD